MNTEWTISDGRYVDTHSHYDDKMFDADRDEVLEKLYDRGVGAVITVGCAVNESRAAMEIAKKHRSVYFASGLHPELVSNAPDNWYDEIKAMAMADKAVAVGEIGLDYHFEGYDKDLQLECFEKQLKLAKELDLPVIVHSRDAAEDTLILLKKYAPVKGVMHCFSGSAETAAEVLKTGMHISFTGVLTFKNSRRAIEALNIIPLDRLLLETDCPYMAPEPYRGTRCDSGMIHSVINRIAAQKGVSCAEVVRQTNENVRRLFNIDTDF